MLILIVSAFLIKKLDPLTFALYILFPFELLVLFIKKKSLAFSIISTYLIFIL